MPKQNPWRALAPLALFSLLTVSSALVVLLTPPLAARAEEPAPPPEPQRFPSGLAITHIVHGTGERPQASDRVIVHYTGRFANDEVFDSSVERGTPARFPLEGVIPCWTEGLQLMRVGGKARLLCPPRIAYGLRGAPPVIPPNATLYFDVELLGIE